MAKRELCVPVICTGRWRESQSKDLSFVFVSVAQLALQPLRCSTFNPSPAALSCYAFRSFAAPRRDEMTEPEKLERGLGLLEATSLNMTFMIGIGPFVVIPFIIRAMNGPQCILAWVVGAALALVDGCVWAELGAAMPQAGGSYVFLREAYGPNRFGRLMSFLFIWQTLFQGPLSISSGALGFADYSLYLTAKMAAVNAWLGAHPRQFMFALANYNRLVAILLIVIAVVLLYRRRHDCLAHLRRRNSLQQRPRLHLPRRRLELLLDFFRRPRPRLRASNLQLPRLLQRLQPRRRDEKSRAQYSPRDFSFDFWHRRALFRIANVHSRRRSLAGSAEIALRRQLVRRTHLRAALGFARHSVDSRHRVRLRFLRHPWLFARSLCSRT